MKGFVLLLCFSMFLSAQEETYHDFRGRSYLRVGETYFNLHEDGFRGDEILTHRLIVKPRGNFPITQAFLNENGFAMFQVEPKVLFDGYYLLKAKHLNANQAEAFERARVLSRLGVFEFMAFDAKVTFSALPCPGNDLHYVNGNQDALDIIKAPQAWCHTTGSPDVVIAVVDQGFDVDHEDLANNVWVNQAEDINGNGRPDYVPVSSGGDLDGLDNDGNGKADDLAGWNVSDNNHQLEIGAHGTNVAGIIGAQRNNGIGVSGIAGGDGSNKGCSLMLLKYDSAFDFGLAISYAADNGAHVINLSGGWENEVSLSWLRWGIEYTVYERGIPIVAAAGNRRINPIQYPAKYDATIAVSAIWIGTLGHGNNSTGPEVDLMAPKPIVTTDEDNEYYLQTTLEGYRGFGGTSACAPQVSGVIGLMLSINPALKYQSGAIRRILEETATKLPEMNGQNWYEDYGYGVVNAYGAVLRAVSY